jgi:type I restriction enzyme, S subunit
MVVAEVIQNREDLKVVDEKNDIPESWCWVQHKDIAKIAPKLPFDKVAEDMEVSFLSMSSVEAITGKCSLLETRKYCDVKKGYTSFIDGDLIFAKITPCMENGKMALLEKLTNGVGFGSTEFHVSRFSNLINRRFFFYYFNQEIFRQNAKKHMTGSAGQLRVSKTFLKKLRYHYLHF